MRWRARIMERFRPRARPSPPAPAQVIADLRIDPGSPPIEAIHQFAQTRKARVVGLVGVERDSGVSLIAQALAMRCVMAGKRALLVDATGAPLETGPREPLRRDAHGFDRLKLRPLRDDLLAMRDIARLRALLQVEYGHYDVVVVDAPAVREAAASALPATIVGGACDALFMVCLTGAVTRTLLEEASATLRGAQAPLAGLVLNRREQPTLGAEIAREARRLRRRAPRLSARIQAWASASNLLDVHA